MPIGFPQGSWSFPYARRSSDGAYTGRIKLVFLGGKRNVPGEGKNVAHPGCLSGRNARSSNSSQIELVTGSHVGSEISIQILILVFWEEAS